jgi:phosphatidylserine/phosphatidylglycerophosphate/cardiolipin synthase-like enzyme
MSVVAHVGPEYSWDQLQAFIKGAKERLVSGIYEFHGTAIKDAIENRLSAVENPLEFDLVMAAQTVKKPRPDKLAAGVEFDREKVFEAWDEDFDNRFRAIIAPVGAKGLVRMSYHIKVSVADDDAVWLSSGNWKQESSQPVVTQAMRDAAGSQDVPGNREWHVILTSKPLADFFRAHLLQDAKRSKHLQGEIVAEDALAGIMVEAPAVVPIVVERPPPRKVLPPLTINGRVSVRPLLTPDRRGAVYSEAVLDLIASARHQLLFQIPYIDPPTDPDKDRGYIDELFEALTRKMRRLPDARIILRGDSSEKYDPANAAWAFKHAGVATADRVKAMDRHHTKGMVVDGRRVLIGSHNWSGLGVSLNRDASLIFDDERIARYYAEAFEIDWARASTVRPKRFVKKVSEGVGGSPAYERVRLGDMWSEDD